jgi:hypothetical protein
VVEGSFRAGERPLKARRDRSAGVGFGRQKDHSLTPSDRNSSLPEERIEPANNGVTVSARSMAMVKDVVNLIAGMAVKLNQPAVNWVAGDGVRRWNIGDRASAGLTDAEAINYLQRPVSRKKFSWLN